jgi:WD40 repeat protein
MSQKLPRSNSSGTTLDWSVGRPWHLSSNFSDADGWIVVWDMTSRRPIAVWKGHDAGVLSVHNWGEDKLITYIVRGQSDGRHGRDGKVFAWQLGEDQGNLDCGLPADGGSRRKPWLLHSIDVKEMTFCGMQVVEVEQVSHLC